MDRDRPAPLRGADLLVEHGRPARPNYQLEAWSRFVTTNEYVWGHLLGSIFVLIFVIMGIFALGVYLSTSRAPRRVEMCFVALG